MLRNALRANNACLPYPQAAVCARVPRGNGVPFRPSVSVEKRGRKRRINRPAARIPEEGRPRPFCLPAEAERFFPSPRAPGLSCCRAPDRGSQAPPLNRGRLPPLLHARLSGTARQKTRNCLLPASNPLPAPTRRFCRTFPNFPAGSRCGRRAHGLCSPPFNLCFVRKTP